MSFPIRVGANSVSRGAIAGWNPLEATFFVPDLWTDFYLKVICTSQQQPRSLHDCLRKAMRSPARDSAHAAALRTMFEIIQIRHQACTHDADFRSNS
jgi:hypothetical protein